MQTALELLILLLVLMDFRLWGSHRSSVAVDMLAWQGLVINALPFFAPSFAADGWVLAVMAVSTLIKALVLPWLLRRAIVRTGAVSERAPYVGFTASILVAVGVLGLCRLASERLGAAAAVPVDPLLVTTTLFTILSGAFLLVARRTALLQAVGFLVMENGVYLFGVVFAVREPWLVQAGVLLDLLAAVFVMGLVLFHIKREFDSVDTDRLANLKD